MCAPTVRVRVSLQLITYLYRNAMVRSAANYRPVRNGDEASLKWSWRFLGTLPWFAKRLRTTSLRKNAACNVVITKCGTLQTHVRGVIQKNMLTGGKGLSRRHSAGAWRGLHRLMWFASSSIWSWGCPNAEGWGRGEQRHRKLEGNRIGRSSRHVGSIFLKKLII